MTRERKRAKHAIRAFALALASCLVLAAAGASGAGAYSFQLEEGAAFPRSLSVSGNHFYGWAPEHREVFCSEAEGEGSLVDETSGTMSLVLHDCEVPHVWAGAKCHSSGAETGTIATKPLAFNLAKLSEGAPGLVLDPTNSANAFAEFTCQPWGTSVKWTGALIGEITEPQAGGGFGNTISIDFNGSQLEQEFTQTYHGWEAHLSQSWGEGSAKSMPVDSSVDASLVGGYVVSMSPEGQEQPQVVVGGGFPVHTYTSSNTTVTLKPAGGGLAVNCAASGEDPALSATGEFSDSVSGYLSFTFHNCKESILGSKCTSSGQSAGVVKTPVVPVELAYLADGSPGISYGYGGGVKVAEMICAGGLVKLVITGNVLGAITTEFGAPGYSLGARVSITGEEEAYEQEYSEIEGGEEFGLHAATNGGEAKPEVMAMQSGLWFGEELTVNEEGEVEGELHEVELRE